MRYWVAVNLGGCCSTPKQPLWADVWHRAHSQSSAMGLQGRGRDQEGWDPLVAAAPWSTVRTLCQPFLGALGPRALAVAEPRVLVRPLVLHVRLFTERQASSAAPALLVLGLPCVRVSNATRGVPLCRSVSRV